MTSSHEEKSNGLVKASAPKQDEYSKILITLSIYYHFLSSYSKNARFSLFSPGSNS